MREFSVVVPLIPEHDRELKSLMLYLKSQSEFIHELVISRSETLPRKHEKVLRKYQKWSNQIGLSFDLKLISSPGIAFDGTNRNRGTLEATAPYIAYLDADDEYSPEMFQILSNVFTESQCDAILHNYSLDASEIKKSKVELITYFELDYPEDKSLLDFENPISGKNSISTPRIHHAHLTIKRQAVEELYLDIFPGADTEYCKRLIRNGKKVIYIKNELSFWNRERSLRYKIRLAKKKFGLK